MLVNTIVIDNLILLFHHRWNTAILAAFHRANGGMRFVVLVNQLSLSRDSLSKSLAALSEMKLVQKNPGYGHPLRPEYILTDEGKSLANLCDGLVSDADHTAVLQKKWSAPVIYVLASGSNRFSEMKEVLSISPRALTQSLKLLSRHDLVTRKVDDGFPPTTTYQLNPTGRRIARKLGAMAALLGG